MTKNKTTKRALLSSVMALFICFAMLLGTTYAWFTDSVTSANNIIQAGNLDIGVYYATPADVVDGDIPAASWKPVTAENSIFNNNALWEPGYTEAVFLKFVNEGSLALQYQLKIDILNEKQGTNVFGEKYSLSEFIQAYACNCFSYDYTNYLFTDREDAIDPEGAPDPYYDTLYNAANGDIATPSGENPLSLDSWQWLEPDEITYATLVLWMPTTVDNRANPKTPDDAGNIELGVSVLATQYTYEKDSFGDQYDKDAAYPVVPSNLKTIMQDENGNDDNISGVVFGTYEQYGDVVAGVQGVNASEGVTLYRVPDTTTFAATSDTTYTLYFLSDSKIVLAGDATGLFRDMKGLTVFDGSNLDMSQVTSTQYLFRGSTNLTDIVGEENWDLSNATSTRGMFYQCSKIETLDVSNWDVSKVENAGWMFYECKALTELDVSNWDTSSMTFAKSMFCNNENLAELDLSGWDMSDVTNSSYMFFRCYKLSSDSYKTIENWDVSSIETFESMFKHAYGMTELDLSNWDTSSATDMNHMFANVGKNLTSLDLSSFDTSKVTNMSWMFYDCNKLVTIYVGDGWSTAALDPSKSTCFYNNQALVGGEGTAWLDVCDMKNANRPWESSAKLDYAIVDGGTENPGLLTYKAN